MYGWYPMMHMHSRAWLGAGVGFIFTIAFWALVVFLIVALLRHLGGKEEQKDSNALDILKERYAKGEIDKKEFHEMKKEIS